MRLVHNYTNNGCVLHTQRVIRSSFDETNNRFNHSRSFARTSHTQPSERAHFALLIIWICSSVQYTWFHSAIFLSHTLAHLLQTSQSQDTRCDARHQDLLRCVRRVISSGSLSLMYEPLTCIPVAGLPSPCLSSPTETT